MKNKNLFVVFAAITLVFGVFTAMPAQAHAFQLAQLIDPLCLFACDDNQSQPQNVSTTYTNSNNTNSNVNSPNSTVNAGNTSTVVTAPVPAPAPAPAPAPVYAYDYNYNYNYNNYPHYPSLQVSCSPTQSSIRKGDRATWNAYASGGNGSYYYTWSGTDGLFGSGSSMAFTYFNTGYKTATVSVTSNGQTVSQACGSMNVYGDYYDNQPPYYPPTYPNYPPVYYPPTYNYQLSVSCSANTSYTNVGGNVNWNAYSSGGNGTYFYTWSGSDGLYGSAQTVSQTYSYPGLKTATVTVYSNGQSITRSCSNTVNVGSYSNNYPYQYPNTYPYQYGQGGLDIACYAEPRTISIDQPTTWTAEATGGVGPYTYSWTGTDGLTGSGGSLIKYYGSAGSKSAVISATSADGRTSTRACSTSVTVRGAYVAPAQPATPAQPAAPANQGDNGLSAASLFSLKNVPWGWVAILVILVLFATVMYLLFNRQKI